MFLYGLCLQHLGVFFFISITFLQSIFEIFLSRTWILYTRQYFLTYFESLRNSIATFRFELPSICFKLYFLFFSSLPNDKILDWSKLKAFADGKSNAIEKLKYVLGWVENMVGKRRKCWFPAFSLFPTMFSKGLFLRVVKSRDCVVKSYNLRRCQIDLYAHGPLPQMKL